MGTIKMAEFRYGREEMLALFDRTVLAPDPLKSIQGLHVEKTQPPLALIQMTEEETVSVAVDFSIKLYFKKLMCNILFNTKITIHCISGLLVILTNIGHM